MNYGDLKSRLLTVLGRAPETVCYELTTADINSSMRLRCMQSTTTLVEAASVSLPADFLQAISAYRDTDPRYNLVPTTVEGINKTYDSSGTPREFAIVDGAMLLNPSPSGSENISFRYYAKLADLSADGDENDVLTQYPSLYVFGVLAFHGELINDSRAAGWRSQYEVEKRRISSQDKASSGGDAPRTPTVRVAN